MLLRRIEEYMKHTKTSPTRFGREVLGDPNFVLNLRDGREPRHTTITKVDAFITAHRPRSLEPLQ